MGAVSKMKKEITDLQQARAIIEAVGEPHQHKVIELLRGITYNRESGYEGDAQKVIKNIELEYALNVANILWSEKYESIPEYIKNWNTDEESEGE